MRYLMSIKMSLSGWIRPVSLWTAIVIAIGLSQYQVQSFSSKLVNRPVIIAKPQRHSDQIHAPQQYTLDFSNEVSRLIRNAFPKDSNTILSHGCWCGSFNENHSNLVNLGGDVSIDKLDQICRDWVKARYVSDRYAGGACKRAKADRKKNHYMLDLKKRQATVKSSLKKKVYLSTCMPGYTAGNKKLSKCEKEDCEIDRKYLSLISFYLKLNPEKSSNIILDENTCMSNHIDL